MDLNKQEDFNGYEKKEGRFKRIVKNRIFIAIIFFFIGGMFMAPGTSEDELKSQIASQKSEIETLNSKVKQADPWFKMNEEEQRKIKEENSKIEAEKLAKAEEELKAKEEAEKKAKEEAEKNKYENGPSYNDVARNPEKHIAKSGKFEGKVVQVMEGDKDNQIRLAVGGDYDKMVLVEYPKNLLESRILEDDYITVYGQNLGTITYESTMGSNITIPAMLADKIDM